MPSWLFALLHLLVEAWSARRDARVRFLMAQVTILRRKLGGNWVVPSSDDRAWLLAIGAELDHRVSDVIGIVTPQTYCRWVMEQREGRRARKAGRPKVARNACELIKRLARENTGWGYRRIIGELHKLRVHVGRSSVRRILKDAGLTPSPRRRARADETVWRKFIRLHLNTMVACDFFTKSVITPLGTRLAFSLAFIHLESRKVYLSPPTYHPHEQWVQQQARNLLMWLDEEGIELRFVVHDRDTKFSAGFHRVLANAGVSYVKTPLLAPGANAFAESWIGTLKRECLNHFLCFSLGHLDHITREFVRFYNEHRPHQSLGNRTLPEAARPPARESAAEICRPGRVRCRQFLGGLLRHYYRAAA
jgi:putative transposase